MTSSLTLKHCNGSQRTANDTSDSEHRLQLYIAPLGKTFITQLHSLFLYSKVGGVSKIDGITPDIDRRAFSRRKLKRTGAHGDSGYCRPSGGSEFLALRPSL